jgi:hypothetical protein
MRGAAPATGALLALLLASSRLASPAQPSPRPPAAAPAPPAPQAQAGTATPPGATNAAGAAGVSVSITGGLEASIAHLPGRLLASAVARNPAGRYGLALLVAERGPAIAAPGAPGKTHWSAGPTSLFFLEPGTREMETVASHLPEKVDAVAALALQGGGKEQGDVLLLSEPGIIYGLVPPWGGGAPAAAGTRQLFAAPGLDLHSVHEDRPGLPRPRLPWVPVARAGQLQLLAAADREGEGARRELRPAASFPLPVAAKREPWGLKLSSDPVQLLPGTPPAGAPRFAFGPEEQGKRRLRTLLFAPEAGAPPVEAWSLLPADEQDVEGTYATLNGRPILLVTSIPKIGILVKRDLRLFLLARDRSRGGNPPAFAVHTDCAIWHHLDAWFVDAGGSGHQDLILVYPEGLRGKKLRFLVYAAVGADRLAAQPRETTLDVTAQDWFYGGDFSGDGIPDLMVRSGRRLLLFPGIAKTDRLADRPAWSFDLPAKRTERPAQSSSGGQHGDRGSRSDGDNDDNESASGDDGGRASHDRTARTLHLAQLVDLRGDGRATLVLSLDDGQGGTDLVAVQRAH